MKTGIELISEERQEQIEKHSRTTEKDVEQNEFGQLGFAAVAMASEYDANGKQGGSEVSRVHHFLNWKPMGWDKEIWKKMISKPYKERLVIAGALIAAEIDRLNNSNQ
jgi:hypothetical protein